MRALPATRLCVTAILGVTLLACGQGRSGSSSRSSLGNLDMEGGEQHAPGEAAAQAAPAGSTEPGSTEPGSIGPGSTAAASAEVYPLPAPAPQTVVVDPRADRRPIDPHIYGANFGSQVELEKSRFPVRRWGGNHTTTYAWDVDTANRANDWFYLNIPEQNANPGALPDDSAADRFIDETVDAGADALVTVPMIGWVPKDRESRASFALSKYGPQTSSNGDAGTGVRPDGSFVTGNDLGDAYRAVGPEYVTDWMRHIASRVGTAAEGGVRFFALDNEVTLWPETHRDIHPDPVSYDELWSLTESYASAMKAVDPNIKLFGPVAWGWCAYFGSSRECGDGPDQAAHGGVPLIPWYLDQVCRYEQRTGVTLVDYLTIHYYPQAPGVFSQDESEATAALRLRGLRSLYDPSYTDESWVGKPMRVIPLMKEWIAQHCPGIRLAITEYNFGSNDGISGLLAQAEAMAIFGREGVDLATRWIAPEDGSRLEDAFALYRNYDGQGSEVAGDSVRAVSWDVDQVGAYAVLAPNNRLHVLLFNKATTEQRVTVQLEGQLSSDAQLFGFDDGHRLSARGTVAGGGSLAVVLPPRSATLAVGDWQR